MGSSVLSHFCAAALGFAKELRAPKSSPEDAAWARAMLEELAGSMGSSSPKPLGELAAPTLGQLAALKATSLWELDRQARARARELAKGDSGWPNAAVRSCDPEDAQAERAADEARDAALAFESRAGER